VNIDLLPFSAFALESSGVSATPPGESHTLTLSLDRVLAHPFEPVMSGSISIGTGHQVPAAPAQSLRAAVVPAIGPVLTITF